MGRQPGAELQVDAELAAGTWPPASGWAEQVVAGGAARCPPCADPVLLPAFAAPLNSPTADPVGWPMRAAGTCRSACGWAPHVDGRAHFKLCQKPAGCVEAVA